MYSELVQTSGSESSNETKYFSHELICQLLDFANVDNWVRGRRGREEYVQYNIQYFYSTYVCTSTY